MTILLSEKVKNYPIVAEAHVEFDNHASLVSCVNKETGLIAFIAMHQGPQGRPFFGATRYWSYASSDDAIGDALRLSKLMSYKLALAGLPYGGAKGVIVRDDKVVRDRARLLQRYAGEVNNQEGRFITGADVGLDQSDIALMRSVSPYIVGVKVDPTSFTALGIYYALEACLDEIYGSPDIDGHSFAIQGVGKIGVELLKLIYPRASRIYVADIQAEAIARAQAQFPNIVVVAPEDIHKQDVDVFAPCALSGVLTLRNIHELKCKMIVGGANSQLESEAVGSKLFEMGILYAPDYIVNAGGLISVVKEYEGSPQASEDILAAIPRIGTMLATVIDQSKQMNLPTNIVSNRVAQEVLNHYAR